MDLETWFQIQLQMSLILRWHPPQTIQMLKKLLIFVTPVKSCYIAAIFINFQVYHRNEKNFESS